MEFTSENHKQLHQLCEGGSIKDFSVERRDGRELLIITLNDGKKIDIKPTLDCFLDINQVKESRLYAVELGLGMYVLADNEKEASEIAFTNISDEIQSLRVDSVMKVKKEEKIDFGWNENSIPYAKKDDPDRGRRISQIIKEQRD